MKVCTECILDLTDACPRGAGRAVDDEMCDEFVPREIYEVNKNESWQLGYKQGRADAIEEIKDISMTVEYRYDHGNLTHEQAQEVTDYISNQVINVINRIIELMEENDEG